MVDIARPDLPRPRRRRRLIVGGAVVVVLVLVSVVVWRLQPAASVVDRASVWIDTVKRGPLVREVRGMGALVSEDLRWIPAVAEGRVERIRLRPGARVEPDTTILHLSNPELEQCVRDAERQLQAAEAQLAARRVELESAELAMQATVATLESEARKARLDAEAEAELYAKGRTSRLTGRSKSNGWRTSSTWAGRRWATKGVRCCCSAWMPPGMRCGCQ